MTKKRFKRIIHTDRLILGPLRDKDGMMLIKILQNPTVGKTFIVPDIPDEDAAYRIFIALQKLSEDEEHMFYGIFSGCMLIGIINEVAVKDDSIEVGYALLPAFYNRGFATEALKAVIEELFARGFTTVKGSYFKGNEASRRVMEKCGMAPSGETETVKYRGKTHICPFYEIKNIQ